MTYLLKWFVILALLVFITMLGGCSTFGIASEEYVEDRVEAVNEARIETAVAVVEPLEPLVPGITAYARDRARGVSVREPPPKAPTDWASLAIGVATAIGLGVPASVGMTNRIRDRRRTALGEPTATGGVATTPKPVPA